MSIRQTPAGATRTCPHCRAVILHSAAVCPSCKKHLRFVPGGDAVPTFSPLRVEGAIRHPNAGEAWEYSVLVTITNDRGEEVGRQVVGVGALQPGEERKFTFAVQMFAPTAMTEAERGVSNAIAGGGELTPTTRRVR
ncbi:MAG: hypothetical protein ABI969_05205 [bacterium]